MKQTQLEQFKGTLEGMLASFERPLRQREEMVAENSADALEYVRNVAERDLAIRQLELQSSRVRDLRGALQRFEEGTYGICLECESEIGIKRLNAVPWTGYCLTCQELADHSGNHAEPRWISLTVLHR